MEEKSRRDVSDGIRWWCPRCKTTKSIRDGSFFAKSRMTLQEWLMLLFFWVDDTPVTKAAKHAQVSEHSAIDAYGWFRDVCSQRLINDGPPQLGGNGVIVQIDESSFSHKPKVQKHIAIPIDSRKVHSDHQRSDAGTPTLQVDGLLVNAFYIITVH